MFRPGMVFEVPADGGLGEFAQGGHSVFDQAVGHPAGRFHEQYTATASLDPQEQQSLLKEMKQKQYKVCRLLTQLCVTVSWHLLLAQAYLPLKNACQPALACLSSFIACTKQGFISAVCSQMSASLNHPVLYAALHAAG